MPAPVPVHSAEDKEKEHQPPSYAEIRSTWRAADGADLNCLCRAEWFVLREKEKPAAEIFSIAYLEDDAGSRPLTFVFNGGPGAASAYLHVGALGTRRVPFASDGNTLPPPTRLMDNPESWLRFTDLVFVDPVGTGFSRPIETKQADGTGKSAGPPVKRSARDRASHPYFGLERDLKSLGEFISRFLSRYDRWDSPVFIAGESYGGFRVAKMVRLLQEDTASG